MYNNCGGPRLAQYVRNAQATLFADLTPEQVLEFTYGVQQYRERPLDRIAAEGLSADYVLRETRRAVTGAGPRLQIWPGIDIDIPTGASDKRSEEHTSELQSRLHLVCRLLLEKKTPCHPRCPGLGRLRGTFGTVSYSKR